VIVGWSVEVVSYERAAMSELSEKVNIAMAIQLFSGGALSTSETKQITSPHVGR